MEPITIVFFDAKDYDVQSFESTLPAFRGRGYYGALFRYVTALADRDGFTLRFKWADHTCQNETVSDFYEHGDSAPYGRFAYLYRAQ